MHASNFLYNKLTMEVYMNDLFDLLVVSEIIPRKDKISNQTWSELIINIVIPNQ
jgi:hypothetical protein